MRKRISFILLLLLTATLTFSQIPEWDRIGYVKQLYGDEIELFPEYSDKTDFSYATIGFMLPNIDAEDGSWYWYRFPEFIYNEYEYGCKLFKSGVVTISVGAGVFALGSILYGCGLSTDNANAIQSGLIFTSLGSGLVGVSVPLFCCGDHLKRNANKTLDLYEILR